MPESVRGPHPLSPHPLSPEGRIAALDRLAADRLDLLVVGGGITGAGVARDAALRGMRVGLVERADFASGTSSRSSKIVHGGVRYLEYFQFGLVRESAVERGILRRIAPHLVHPLPFLYPVYQGESLAKIQFGLKLFDLFAGPDRSAWSRTLSPTETRRYLPGLRDPLKGSVLYPEFITDDARLTLANIASAAEHGALVANHAPVEGLLREGDRVVGAHVKDTEGAREFDIRAEVTVLAVGPWAEQALRHDGIPAPKPLIPSKGIHILFERARLPLRAATFLRSRAGRRGLALPRGPWVYVGTSDVEYEGSLDGPRAEAPEVDELLEMTRDCFPGAELGVGDVKATWAGVRPLIREAGKSTRDTSRHDEVWIPAPGLVTVAGGKLTTYRPMAVRILERVAEARGRPLPGTSSTAGTRLPGAPHEDLEAFRSRTRSDLFRLRVDEPTRERLEFLYGTEIEDLVRYASEDRSWAEPLGPGIPALRGEVRLAVERGMALTLDDVMDRRLALLIFARGGGWDAAGEAASILARLLGWDPARRDAELGRYRRLVTEHGPRGIDTTPGLG